MKTPMLKQWETLKKDHPDKLLLFRVGDFYEAFGDDAVLLHDVLGLATTHRLDGQKRLTMAGFPHQVLRTYLRKLLDAKCRVAVCEQVTDADPIPKGKITRKVVDQ